jgi:putative ABC transport system substrate-binding protein
MRRREFISLLGGGTVALPLAARAQQLAMPVIGFLGSEAPDGYAERLNGYRRGLQEAGYTEGKNVTIEYRWAEGHRERLSALADEFVRRRVAVSLGTVNTAIAAKTATKAIPVVFLVGEDPVRLGLVTSMARPGGNLTGINLFNSEVNSKRLELLRMLVPSAMRVAVLVNPTDPANAEAVTRDVGGPAARTMGLQQSFEASTSREIDAAFASISAAQSDGLFVAGQTFFNSRRVHLVHLASHHHLPTSYGSRAYPEVGGLMSYGTDVIDAYRQAGSYSGQILKGARAADLPVVQPSKFQLVVNVQTARMQGLTVSPSLLALADEVIE